MYGAKELTKENVLKLLTEYDIFNFYIKGFNDRVIKFNSELRDDDNNASCSITFYNNRLLYKDFGTNESYDCFEYIKTKYNLTFYETLSVINIDFDLGLSNSQNKVIKRKQNIKLITGITPNNLRINHKLKEIRVKRRAWNFYDAAYWGSYYLTRKMLEKYNISPVSHYWINENIFTTDFKKNLTYVYFFGSGKYKLMRPNDLQHKWFGNCTSSIIQGWNQLPEKGSLLIITKSLKDVVIYSMFGISAIAPQAESNVISEEIITQLKNRFKVIISNYDYDRAGKLGAVKLRRLYDIQSIMFDNNFTVKDLGEYIQENGFTKTKYLIYETRIKYRF